MLQRLLVILFLTFSITEQPLTWSGQRTHHVAAKDQLDQAFSLLIQLPEIEALVERIESEGSFYIEPNTCLSSRFEGYWNPTTRTIYVTKNLSLAEALTTILFEMHNALNTKTLDHYDTLASTGQISRKDYIRCVEYWEYQNALATSQLLQQGIDQGLFPEECDWQVHDNFEDHFRLQQSAGHSAHIGKMYDSIV